MLSQMREGRFIKTVLWIVVVAFVATMVFVWGADLQGMDCSGTAPQGEQWVGKVGKVGISLRDYDNRYRNGRSQLSQNRQPGQVLTADELLRLQDQVFEQMVNETLFQLEVDRLGLTPSEAEIGDVLQFDPPELLMQQFRNEEGVFDRNAYELALNNPNVDWTPFEEYVRSSLPSTRLQQMLISSIHIGEGEIRAEFERRFRKVTVGYAGKAWRDIELEGEDPDDETLRAYLAENAADYEQEERFRMTAVKLSRDPSPADEEYIRGRLDFLRTEIEGGKAFEQMAKEWSQDLSNAEQGGDLGWFGLGRMDPAFEEAAFALSEGEVSQPVRSSFGYHLIKVDSRRTQDELDEVSARHILLRVEPSYATLDSIQAEADSLTNRTDEGLNLADAAAALGLEALRPAPFSVRESIEGLGYNNAIKARVSRMEVGEVTRRFSARDADYLIQLDEKIPVGPGDFESQREALLAAWREDQQRAAALEQGKALHAAVQSGRSLADVAEAQEVEYKISEPFGRRDYIPGIGPEGSFQRAAFILNQGEMSGVIEAQQGAYVMEVIAKPESDKALYNSEHDGIRDRLLSTAQQRYFTSWMAQLKERFPVEDFREEFYN